MTASKREWPRPYRALRPRSLGWQFGVLVVIETVLFRFYNDAESPFHWATHFLVAVAFTALVLLAWLLLTGAPGPRFLLLPVIGFHVFAAAPDLLFLVGIPHFGWDDIFLGHVASHYLPGGLTSWLIVALLCWAAYLAVLTSWLRTREVAAAAVLAPSGANSGSYQGARHA